MFIWSGTDLTYRDIVVLSRNKAMMMATIATINQRFIISLRFRYRAFDPAVAGRQAVPAIAAVNVIFRGVLPAFSFLQGMRKAAAFS